jgi:hypothetical protein
LPAYAQSAEYISPFLATPFFCVLLTFGFFAGKEKGGWNKQGTRIFRGQRRQFQLHALQMRQVRRAMLHYFLRDTESAGAGNNRL